MCSRTGRPAQLTREAGAATQCRLGGTGTITPVHIVYRRRQSARCGTCRPRMRPSVRSRHRPRTHRSASSGPSMRRSAAAHCSACQLTRSGRKRRKTDARSKLNRSQAWPWPGRASAVPAEVRIVAARGYLNKRCSNIAPAEPVPPRHTCAGRGWVSAAVPKHARASVAGRVASRPSCSGAALGREGKQTKQQRGVRYSTPAAPWAEGRSPEEPRSVTNAGLVRAGARCTVQPLWAERAGPCSRCGMCMGACASLCSCGRAGGLVRGRDGGRREKGRKGR